MLSIFSKIREIASLFDGAGQEIHVLDGPNGEVHVKEINPMDYIYTGEQWCPNCHEKMVLKDDIYECPICYLEIFKDEADNGYGYPTFESSYEEDYGEYYSDKEIDDDDGWH